VSDPALLVTPPTITRIDWSLAGNGIGAQATIVMNPPAEPCFRENATPETFLGIGNGYLGSGFDLKQVLWWRWAWSPITVPATNCIVSATIHTASNGTWQVSSDPFEVRPSLAYETLIGNPANNLADWNATERVATNTSYTTVLPHQVGWFDAGGENGENRAIASLVSALSRLYRTRRPEYSTVQCSALADQIVNGADFLTSLGEAENLYSLGPPVQRVHQDTVHQTNRQDDAHEFYDRVGSGSGPPAEEQHGHVWHESHLREKGRPSGDDVDDNRDSATNQWISCVGLLDAALAVDSIAPYLATELSNWKVQADRTRTFLHWISGYRSLAPDWFYTYRAQAMLDFLYSEVFSDPTAFTDACSELATDLIQYPPTTSDQVRRYWALAGQLNINPLGKKSYGDVDPSIYSPAEALMYAIEHGAPDPPPPCETWAQAINSVISNWYDSPNFMQPGSIHPNPLRISINWSPDVSLEDYYGFEPFDNKFVALEGSALARLAQFFGHSDGRFQRLVDLATGDANYLLGINAGVGPRQVLSTSRSLATDSQYVGAGFINGAGTHWGAQCTHAAEHHIWPLPQFTATNGPSAQKNLDPTTKQQINWTLAPFEFSRGRASGTETFIKTDASVIALVDTLDRALHPRLVVEAESGSSSPALSVMLNNFIDTTVSPAIEYFNGGQSVFGATSGSSIHFSGLMSPESAISPGPNYRFRVKLRASNYGTTPCTVSLTVTQGSASWSDSFVVAITGSPYAYVVVESTQGIYSSNPLTLQSGVAFSATLSIGGSGQGPCDFDDVVFESEGIPR